MTHWHSTARSGASTLFGALLLLTGAACENAVAPSPTPTPVAAVSIDSHALTLTVGSKRSLTATVRGAAGEILSGRTVAWTTSDDRIASVSPSGEVTAVSAGSAKIKATSEGRADSATVTVNAGVVPVASLEIEGEDEVTLSIGDAVQFTAVVRDAEGSELPDRPIDWSTSVTEVAIVSETGLLTAVAAGQTILRAVSEDRFDSVRVWVRAAVAEVVISGPAEIALAVGDIVQLAAEAKDESGEALPDRSITWSTASAAVATVSETGVITASGAGRTHVTAESEGKSASVEILVTVPYPFDLVYDSRTGYVPGRGNEPEIFRMAFGREDAIATRIIEHPQVWDVSPSPDGKRIAFTCVHGHGTTICVANADGSGAVALMDGTSLADQPTWSPDGTRIAYRRWQPGASPGEFNPTRIWVMNSDGSGQTNLTSDSEAGSWQENPTWSPRQPDGSYRIAYSHQTRSGEYVVGRIASVRHDGQDIRAVTAGGEYLEREPSWSPDAERIVFTRTGGTAAGDLWVVNANGGGEHQLMTIDPADDQRSPAWSPDGNYIAFTSKHEPTDDNRWSFQIYTVRPDGTGITRWTHTGIDKENPSWIRR